jgi:MFS family permease
MVQTRALKANIPKMYAIRLLFWMHFIAAVIVPFFTLWGGIRFSQILYLNAWFMFWNFLLEVPTGTVADFMGRKISLVSGSIIAALGVLVYVSHPHIAVFLVAEVIFATAYTLNSGADEALIYDTLIQLGQEDQSKKILSRMESIKLTGIVVGAVAGGFIAKTLGLRMVMIVMAIPMVTAGLIALTLKEPEVHEQKPVLSFKSYKKLLSDGFKFFWKSNILKTLTLDMVLINGCAWIIIWFYQALLTNAGLDISYFGFVHALMSVSQILIISNFIRLEAWLGSKKRLLFLGAFLTGIFFILIGLTTFAPLVIIGITFSAGFGLSRLPLFSSYMNKYIPSDKRATILSTTSMMRTLAIVIVNIIAGLLAESSIPNTLLVLGIAMVLFSFFSKIKEEHLID